MTPVSDSPEAAEPQGAANRAFRGSLPLFLETAWRNANRTLADEPERRQAIEGVDAVYRALIVDPGVNERRVAATFLVRSHASFLAAAALGLSGQAAESYVQMRAALGTALEGWYVDAAEERQRRWLQRNDDEEAAALAEQMLAGPAALDQLRTIDPETAHVYERLQRRTIQRAAHPNTYADLSRRADGDVAAHYFVCGDDVQRSCLRSVAQAGICCLSIFYYAFGERYRELELGAAINKLRVGH